jgi:hypothetical protein
MNSIQLKSLIRVFILLGAATSFGASSSEPAATRTDPLAPKAETSIVVTDGSQDLKVDPGTTTIVAKPFQLLSSTDNGTLTQSGVSVVCPPSGFIQTAKGYNSIAGSPFFPVFGSYSPVTLTGGKTVKAIYDNNSAAMCISAASSVYIGGFSASPGASWLTSAKCNGVTRTGASATFSYSAGIASWRWSGLLFGFTGSGSTSCTLIHN